MVYVTKQSRRSKTGKWGAKRTERPVHRRWSGDWWKRTESTGTVVAIKWCADSEVQTLQGEILAIQQNAANEKRQLNEQEIADIKVKRTDTSDWVEALEWTVNPLCKNEFAARVRTMDLKVHRNFYKRKRRSEMMKSYRFKRPTTQKYSYCRVNLACKEEDRAYYEEQIANLEQDKQKRLQNSVTFTTNIYELSKNTTRNYWRNQRLEWSDPHRRGGKECWISAKGTECMRVKQITESGCYTYITWKKAQMRISWSIMIRQQEDCRSLQRSIWTLVGYSQEIQAATMEMALSGKGLWDAGNILRWTEREERWTRQCE